MVGGRDLGQLYIGSPAFYRVAGKKIVSRFWRRRLSYIRNPMLRGFIDDHPGLWHMLFNYSVSDGYEILDWYERKVQRLLGIVETTLSPLFGGAGDGELANATRTLWAGLHGITALSQAGKLNLVTGQSVRDMAHSLAGNFVAGVRARQRSTGE